jgi:hypothetical protein
LWLYSSPSPRLQASTDFTIDFEPIISSTSSPTGSNFCCYRVQDASPASEHHPHRSNSLKYLPGHAASCYHAAVSFFDFGIHFYQNLVTSSACLKVPGSFRVGLFFIMRLLHTETLQLHEFFGANIPPYAILSHTWGEGEVSFQEMQSGDGKSKAGYEKIRRCCERADADGFLYC